MKRPSKSYSPNKLPALAAENQGVSSVTQRDETEQDPQEDQDCTAAGARLCLFVADLRSSGAPSDEASHGSCEARWARSGSPDESPAGAFCVGAQKLDALGDVSRSPGNTTPYSPVRRSPKRRQDAFGPRLLFSPPEARSPIAGEPVILGSDRPNGGTRSRAGCRVGGISEQRPVRHRRSSPSSAPAS